MSTRAQQKWDESDFQFEIEDMSSPLAKTLEIEKGRVLTKPRPRRNVRVGTDSTKSYVLCLHGRFLAEQCGSCEYEAPRIEANL